jgi:hypothetical protein
MEVSQKCYQPPPNYKEPHHDEKNYDGNDDNNNSDCDRVQGNVLQWKIILDLQDRHNTSTAPVNETDT